MGRGKAPAKAISMTALQKALLDQEFRKRTTILQNSKDLHKELGWYFNLHNQHKPHQL